MDWLWQYGGYAALAIFAALAICLGRENWRTKPIKREDYRPDIAKYQHRNPPKDGSDD